MNLSSSVAAAPGTNVPGTCPTTGLDADVCFGTCCAKPATSTTPTFAETVAYTLHRAAAAYRVGEIAWGKDFFIRPDDGCRCALGAIAYVVDPLNGDGNPYDITDPEKRNVAVAAADALATYLVNELDATDAIYGAHERDVPEVVAAWNDDQDSAAKIIGALEAAAEHQA